MTPSPRTLPRTLRRRSALLSIALAVLLCAVPSLLLGGAVRAAPATVTATMAGLETSRKTPVEVVVFNATGASLTLDLRLLDAEGNAVLDRPEAVVVGAFQTRVISVEEELSREVAKRARPYEGLVAIELTGAAPFAEDAAIVHATQFFGKRKKPRGAVVLRPVFRSALD